MQLSIYIDKGRKKSKSKNFIEYLINKTNNTNNNFYLTCQDKSITNFMNNSKDNHSQNLYKFPSKKNIK
jgi:hypothetical protein